MKLIRKFGILLTFFITETNGAKPILIFDLGNVLVETRYFKSMMHIGPLNMISYSALTFNNPFSCYTKLYEILHEIEPLTPHDSIIKDQHGTVLPSLMVKWLKGTFSGHKIICLINNYLNERPTWFESPLIKSLAETIFIPENFVATRYIVPEGNKFLQECKNAGYTLFLLSNWDPSSFELLYSLNPDFFNLFDEMIVSGFVHMVKPNADIYEYIFNTFRLNPSDCILIDDQEENIRAAEQLGMYGIHYQKKRGLFFCTPDFETVREKINLFEQLKYFPIPIDSNR